MITEANAHGAWRHPAGTCVFSGPPIHEADIWRSRLDLTPERISGFREILSDMEKDRADRFLHAVHHDRFVVSHGILRKLLGGYLGMNPSGIQYSTNAHGKPALRDGPGGIQLHFNLSHSNNLALFAFTRQGEIGVDVEYMDRRRSMEKLAGRFFSRKEADAIEGLPPGRPRLKGFFSCWTRKEAFLKAEGSGLAIPLNHFEVSLLPGEKPALLNTAWSREGHLKWRVFDVDAGEGYAAAVVAGKEILRLRCFESLAFLESIDNR